LIITIIAGEKYIDAVPIFRGLIPVMFLSFPSMLMGWPSLGAISKEKQVTFSTIVSALFQISVLAIFIVFDIFTMTAVIILRSVTEFVLMAIRGYFVLKYRNSFKEGQENVV
jgi:PST family polysaccharide transporter